MLEEREIRFLGEVPSHHCDLVGIPDVVVIEEADHVRVKVMECVGGLRSYRPIPDASRDDPIRFDKRIEGQVVKVLGDEDFIGPVRLREDGFQRCADVLLTMVGCDERRYGGHVRISLLMAT
jgi:hypothetical protein